MTTCIELHERATRCSAPQLLLLGPGLKHWSDDCEYSWRPPSLDLPVDRLARFDPAAAPTVLVFSTDHFYSINHDLPLSGASGTLQQSPAAASLGSAICFAFLKTSGPSWPRKPHSWRNIKFKQAALWKHQCLVLGRGMRDLFRYSERMDGRRWVSVCSQYHAAPLRNIGYAGFFFAW